MALERSCIGSAEGIFKIWTGCVAYGKARAHLHVNLCFLFCYFFLLVDDPKFNKLLLLQVKNFKR